MRRVLALTAAAGALAAVLPLAVARGQEKKAPVHGLVAPSREAGFTGSKVCRECHAATHSSWSNGRHSKMLQPATSTAVIPRFDGVVSLHGKEYRLEREGDAFFVVETYLQSTPTRRRVEYTLGSRRVQHYLSRLEDGRIVVLPPSYDVEKKEWFHNLDIVDLEESGAVKVQVWNSNCWGCHVSGEQKGFDPATRAYATTWTDFGTTCERCHGPGAAHAAKYAKSRKGAEAASVETRAALAPASTDDRDTLIVHPRRLDPARSTALCAQCHSLRDVTRTGFAGGDDYFDFYTPLLEYAQKRNHDPAWWPNGRPRRFSNDGLAFWESRCFQKGGATCVMCHTDVHEPNIERNETVAKKQEALCATCHAAIVASGEAHTHHPKAAADVTCVSCHMPRTSISLRHRMPDHTLSLPAPVNTAKFGIPNACNECHKDRSPDWAETALLKWFPAGKRGRLVEDATAFTAGAKRDPLALKPLRAIAGDATRAPLIRANALGYLRGYLGGSGEAGEGAAAAAIETLLAATTDREPALRLVALLSLGDAARIGTVRAAMERGLQDERRTVRMAAALGIVGSGATAGGGPAASLSPGLRAALDGAIGDHARRAQFLNEDATAQMDLGKMLFLVGRYQSAETSMRDALRLDPRLAGGSYFLGLATLGQGKMAEGVALLKGVDRKDPHRKDAEAILQKLNAS